MTTAGEEVLHAHRDALPEISREPYYLPAADEIALFESSHRHKLAVLLKGPTGCGKTRFVEHMAWRLHRPLITVACHDDLTASDLVGRYLVQHDCTVWQDGPLTRAVRQGALCYLDELVEARQDTTVVLHPLADYRRLLPIDKTGELLHAAEGFQLIVSYNPNYQHALKDLKPSTRQRFVALELGFPAERQETAIIVHETGVTHGEAAGLVQVATRLRALQDRGLVEVPSTRLLVASARLISSGIEPRRACDVGMVAPLTDNPVLVQTLRDVVQSVFS